MKKYKPTSAGRRDSSVVDYRQKLTTTKSRPFKRLVLGRGATGGRNSQGRTTSFYRGAGHKRRLRLVDFRYDKRDLSAVVETIEYDPNRSGFIALVRYRDGERRYILAPQGLAKGDEVITSSEAKVKVGNRLPLSGIPVGTFVYNVEIKPGAGAKLARSAGNYAEVVAQEGAYTQLKMPSTEIRRVIASGWASVGAVSNEEYRLVELGKAGRARHRGRRPRTRGSARNAVDHPHGGGEGRSPRGHRRARTRQGRPTGKGQKTRSPKKYSNSFIIKRRKPGRLMAIGGR
jgi:large subunit ribosomal protein L2